MMWDMHATANMCISELMLYWVLLGICLLLAMADGLCNAIRCLSADMLSYLIHFYPGIHEQRVLYPWKSNMTQKTAWNRHLRTRST